MYLKRKIDQYLQEWKAGENRKPLIVKGARQIGKTESIREFAKANYSSFIEINFVEEPKYKTIIEEGYAAVDIIKNISRIDPDKKFIPQDTLILFDELQEFPEIATSLKFFCQDGRFDVICSGSLLGISYQRIESNSVGYKNDYLMYSMDFEEFLWALGDETTVPYLQDCFEKMQPLGQAMHRRVMNDFRQYILTGGMPQVVDIYRKTKSFEDADRIKKRILTLYRQDITKFARGYEAKVLAVFDELPSQLSKTEKKYKLSEISKGARFRDYENAFMWLAEAMIVNNCYNATEPTVGLAMSEEHTTRKCYMADTGLLVAHSFMDDKFTDNELYRDILLDRLHVNEGMLMENIVAQELRASGHKLFFYSRSDTNNRENNMEIDFLIRKKRKICPIEVKSGVYRKHSSLDKFRSKFKGKIGQPYILYTKDVFVKEEVIHLPIYMAMFL